MERLDADSAKAPAVLPSEDEPEDEPVVKIAPKLKVPSGVYTTLLPFDGKIEQTVSFNKNYTFQLQEKYLDTPTDSTVVTTGTWSPSDGFIWLYKDQLVRGRYNWSGDTLEYFSPYFKKNFTMHKLEDVLTSSVWQNRYNDGTQLYGIGTEPFWSVEVSHADSISFLLSEWSSPVTLKASEMFHSKDSALYKGYNDSTQLSIVVYPFFCSDGMSDIVYKNRIRVQYNRKVFEGCGVKYK